MVFTQEYAERIKHVGVSGPEFGRHCPSPARGLSLSTIYPALTSQSNMPIRTGRLLLFVDSTAAFVLHQRCMQLDDNSSKSVIT
jgi:hypothetical protein